MREKQEQMIKKVLLISFLANLMDLFLILEIWMVSGLLLVMMTIMMMIKKIKNRLTSSSNDRKEMMKQIKNYLKITYERKNKVLKMQKM
jgi:hypothetical protein